MAGLRCLKRRLCAAVDPHPIGGCAAHRLPAERQSGHLSSHGEPRRRRHLRRAHRQRHLLRRAQCRVHRVRGDQRDHLRARRPLADHLRRRIRLLGAVQADRVAARAALDAPADLHRLAGQAARRARRDRQRQRLRRRRLRRRQLQPRPRRVGRLTPIQRPHLRPIARLRLQTQPAEVEPPARRRAFLHHPAALPQTHVVNQHARTQPLPVQPQPARRQPAHPQPTWTQTGHRRARLRRDHLVVRPRRTRRYRHLVHPARFQVAVLARPTRPLRLALALEPARRPAAFPRRLHLSWTHIERILIPVRASARDRRPTHRDRVAAARAPRPPGERDRRTRGRRRRLDRHPSTLNRCAVGHSRTSTRHCFH